MAFIATIDPRCLKFGDKKHLKGKGVFNRKNRCNPFTGVVLLKILTPDFTNTYNLTGFARLTQQQPGLQFGAAFTNELMQQIILYWN